MPHLTNVFVLQKKGVTHGHHRWTQACDLKYLRQIQYLQAAYIHTED
jgi:hypothetical protein